MEISHVFLGHLTWAEYLGKRAFVAPVEKALQSLAQEARPSDDELGNVQIRLHKVNYQIAAEAGFGAIQVDDYCNLDELGYCIEISVDKFTEGIDQLQADFNLLLGDVIWKVGLHRESLRDLLRDVRLDEFEREARPYRVRAERAYANGWYEEALNDFLGAETKNYADFSVHRSIASILLYHIVDLPRALEYFLKAARYALPCDARQAAEGYYYAGMACAIQRRFEDAYHHLQSAAATNPKFYEAVYQRACVAALLGEATAAVESLEEAVTGDPRYHERARRSLAFDSTRPQVEALLDHLTSLAHQKLALVRRDAEPLQGHVIVNSESREHLASLFHRIEEQLSAAHSYKSILSVLETIGETHTELESLSDIFSKQYEIDGYDYIRSLAFSPDGSLLASGFLYEGIKVWEVDSGIKIRALKGHTSRVNSLAFSPNNQWLASGSRDRTVRIWEIDSGRELRVLDQHEGEIRAVAFSPDGEWLISGGHDQTLKLWRVITGNEVQVFEGHTHHVTTAAFAPGGELLASGSSDKTIKLWDLRTGRELQTLEGHTRGVETLTFSPDGRWLASGGIDKVVRVWDLTTGRQVMTLEGSRNEITSLSFSLDGELIAAGSLGRAIRIWKWATGRAVRTLRFQDISWNPVAFSPEGEWLALGGRQVEFWLKAVLTREQYEKVKAGEERAALLQSSKSDMTLVKQFEQEWLEEQEAEEQAALKELETRLCKFCQARLSLFERITGKRYCKAHRKGREKP